MPYIPEQHKKYHLLPRSQSCGGEVFEYPCSLIDRAEELLGTSEGFFPYGFFSYEGYFSSLDSVITKFADNPDAADLLQQIKAEMRALNHKEVWSVLKYIGPSTGKVLGLTYGRHYYWPCRKENPVYCGVIDDEEFTAYLYPTDAALWKILEDPTGMAYKTIHQNGKGHMSKEAHADIMRQLHELEERVSS